MKPVFFPHTSIEPALAAALNACLGPVTLFHPLVEAAGHLAVLAEARQIELVLPCPDGADRLLAALDGFKRWASEHAGQDLAGLMRQHPEIPFFDTHATSRIAAEVKSAGLAPGETTAEDRLHRARLLLLMAQEFDVSRRELETDFRRLEVQERRMLAMLKGEAADAAGGETGASPAGAERPPLHMPRARTAAWARLALQAEAFWRANTDILFLTASMDVLDHVRAQAAAEPLLSGHIAAGGSDDLQAWLADPQGPPPINAAPAMNSTASPVGLTLFRLPGRQPQEWLRQLAGEGAAVPVETLRRASARGALAGHAELV